MEQFKQFCQLKQHMKLEDIFKSYNSKTGDIKSFKKMIISHLANSTSKDLMAKSVSGNNMKDNSDENKIHFKHQAIGRDNIKYVQVQQHILEDLMLNDIESFIMFYEHARSDLLLVDEQDEQAHEFNINQFNNNTMPSLIVLNNGYIWDLNNVFN